jgi:hypothetical protein
MIYKTASQVKHFSRPVRTMRGDHARSRAGCVLPPGIPFSMSAAQTGKSGRFPAPGKLSHLVHFPFRWHIVPRMRLLQAGA